MIAVEGRKTEPQYFAQLNKWQSDVHVNCLKSGAGSSPNQVLKRMKEFLKKSELKSSDEARLVVDRDQWTEEQLNRLQAWVMKDKRRGLALSNPNFEFWLLLHFEEGKGLSNSNECITRLRHYLRDYDKGIGLNHLRKRQVEEAIRRAKRRDHPPCSAWPPEAGRTTVYRLVAKILNPENGGRVWDSQD